MVELSSPKKHRVVVLSVSQGKTKFICAEDRKCLMRLNCETGRYITEKELIKSNATRLWHKRCEFCVSEETKWLSYLPCCNIIEEDEHRALISCPRFHQLRTELHKDTKSLLLRNEDHHLLYMRPHVTRFGGYVRKVFRQRFPRKEKKHPP